MGCGASAKPSSSGKYVADAATPEIAAGLAACPDDLSEAGNVSAKSSANRPSVSNKSSYRSTPARGADLSSSISDLPDLPGLAQLEEKSIRPAAVTAATLTPARSDELGVALVNPNASASRCAPKGKECLEARAESLTVIFRTYETDAAAAVAANPEKPTKPLVSPDYVQLLAHILGADLAREPFLVPAAKLLLPSLMASFRKSGCLKVEDARHCLDVFRSHRETQAKPSESPSQRRASPTGKASCVECAAAATCYCPDCEDSFCTACFAKLHSKGNRATHVRLDVSMAGFKAGQMSRAAESDTNVGQISMRWHAFSDAQGIRFFYNFERQEMVRTIPKDELAWQPPPPLPS